MKCELVDLGVGEPETAELGPAICPWPNATVGEGNTPREALEDALEQIGEDDPAAQERIDRWLRRSHPHFYGPAGARTAEEIAGEDEEETDPEDDDTLVYAVGIRWSQMP